MTEDAEDQPGSGRHLEIPFRSSLRHQRSSTNRYAPPDLRLLQDIRENRFNKAIEGRAKAMRDRNKTAENPDGPGYEHPSYSGYIYTALIFFIAFLGALPYILRRCGCGPPRPASRARQWAQNGEDTERNEPELSEEERKELIEQCLHTTEVAAHSASACRVGSLSNESNGKDGEDDGQEGTDDDERNGDGLDPCHICLENFRIGDEVAWSKMPTCKHFFHKQCIFEWMQKKHQDCPCCRSKILALPSSDEETNSSSSSSEIQIVIHEENEHPSTSSNGKNSVGRCSDCQKKSHPENKAIYFCVQHGLNTCM